MPESPSTLTEERRTQITALLAAEGRVVASDLGPRLSVSVDTVQRDLAVLEERGLVRRVRGGALPPSPHPVAAADREELSVDAKWRVASATWRALATSSPPAVLAIGGGTTAVTLARCAPTGLAAAAFTPSPEVALALIEQHGVDATLCGGRLHPAARTLVGPGAVDAFRAIRPDVAVVSACSLDAAAGLTIQLADEAPVVAAMIGGARRVVVMATAERLGTAAAFAVAGIDAVDVLVTDARPAETAAYAAAGVQVVHA